MNYTWINDLINWLENLIPLLANFGCEGGP